MPGHRVRICKDGTEWETGLDRRRAIQEVYVGIDVSKDHLDVSVTSEARVWREANNPEGIASLLTIVWAA